MQHLVAKNIDMKMQVLKESIRVAIRYLSARQLERNVARHKADIKVGIPGVHGTRDQK